MTNRKKIIIDTDCGSDDAMAIAMALRDSNYEILMFSTVAGNVSMNQATINTLTTIEYADTYAPPVYCGSRKMLVRDLAFAHETHGRDGLGDIGLVPQKLKISSGSGVLKMLDLLRNSDDGEIDIITLGPLTNIALALRLDEDAMRKVGNLIIMGSAGLGRGNVTPVAEFNIWQDPEAAKIVIESGLPHITLVGWDACLGDCMLSPQEISMIRKSGSLGQFVIDCNRELMQMNIGRFGDAYLDMADPSAVAVALYPACIAACEPYYCEVDITQGPSYGAVIVDVDHCTGKKANVRICSKLNPMLYKQYMYAMLGVKSLGE
ncbi:nucleoside hydrolase [Gardnerella vaginalis]|uniref:nucleoside hydrolase n=1 Tax=Gardnerella vaginalis TaxID=2702 RepID=UPI000353240A|nr:nucleoside hydrolase [Gardnerella vaginalis]EPI43658.1 Inosine-uridine preferring nucleoside hydrolase [Gardnerella vaginalis JCP8481A]EPI44643.1 Inosine-uridine preferring nucleoside hydrolase [Gardnerella vaginalis JCP8481B]